VTPDGCRPGSASGSAGRDDAEVYAMIDSMGDVGARGTDVLSSRSEHGGCGFKGDRRGGPSSVPLRQGLVRRPRLRASPASVRKRGSRAAVAGTAELGSDDAHAGGLRALLALADLELDALALVEAAESAGVDLGVVHEHVRAADAVGLQ
jgi:hypothetical protein